MTCDVDPEHETEMVKVGTLWVKNGLAIPDYMECCLVCGRQVGDDDDD